MSPKRIRITNKKCRVCDCFVKRTHLTYCSIACSSKAKANAHIKDLRGKVFYRLTVVELSERRAHDGMAYWLCRCICGTEKEVSGRTLREGTTRSCGCYHSECARAIQRKYIRKHGKTGTSIYITYREMMIRCYDPDCPAFASYGARGITVDPAWHDFEAFYRDMGDPPEGKTLDRIDNDGPYSPSNCRWSTPKEQANNRRSNKLITFNGVTMNQKQWADQIGMTHKNLHARLKDGWSIKDALTRPLRKMRSGCKIKKHALVEAQP